MKIVKIYKDCPTFFSLRSNASDSIRLLSFLCTCYNIYDTLTSNIETTTLYYYLVGHNITVSV